MLNARVIGALKALGEYVLNALLLTAATYLLMYWNIISKPFVSVPWTTPPIIGHYLVTGGDWKARQSSIGRSRCARFGRSRWTWSSGR